MLTHVVLFTLKDPSQIPTAVAALRSLEGQVPTLQSVEVGVDMLPSGRSAHIALITRFQDADAMQAYQVHPAHQEVLKVLGPLVERALKVDYLA